MKQMKQNNGTGRYMIILDEIKGAKKIAIGGHIRPDGDCVGSCMAMYLYLRKAVPDAGECIP